MSEEPATKEIRCSCKSLLAKATVSGIEIKCRRCQRIVEIPFEAFGRWVDLDHASGARNLCTCEIDQQLAKREVLKIERGR